MFAQQHIVQKQKRATKMFPILFANQSQQQNMLMFVAEAGKQLQKSSQEPSQKKLFVTREHTNGMPAKDAVFTNQVAAVL